MTETAIAREDWLSTRRMLGGGAPGGDSAARRRSLACRFADPGRVREAIEAARDNGARAIVAVGSPAFFAAVGPARGGGAPLPIHPVVPNIQGFMREAVEFGMAGAGMRRVARMGVGPLLGLGLRGVGRAPRILARDFPTLLLCFVELELAEFRRRDPPVVLLQAQATDLALAMDNPRPIAGYAGAVRRLTGARAGFATRNPERLVERLAAWGVEPGPIVAPRAVAGAGIELWADRSGLSDAGEADARGDARSTPAAAAPIRGFVRDDDAFLGLVRG